MKIICFRCGKVIGEQQPFDNLSETKAKCLDCLSKEKEEASKFQPMPKPGEKKEVVLENGLKGILWVAENDAEKLSVWELAVLNKKFLCSGGMREEFQKHLASIKDEEAEVSFLYSISIKIPPKGSKKKDPVRAGGHKDESVQYNCTMKAPKYYIQRMYDGMAGRMRKFLDIIVGSSYKAYKEEVKAEYISKSFNS